MLLPKFSSEKGSAVFEFVTLGLLLNISVLTFSVQLMTHFQAQFASESAARHAARAVAKQAPADAVNELANSIARDFSFEPDAVDLRISCQPADCTSPGSLVAVEVNILSAKARAVIVQSDSYSSNQQDEDSDLAE